MKTESLNLGIENCQFSDSELSDDCYHISSQSRIKYVKRSPPKVVNYIELNKKASCDSRSNSTRRKAQG